MRPDVMKTRELIERMRESATLSVEPQQLQALLELGETVRADDTFLAGWIRILRVEGQLVVQEQTPEGEVLLRGFATREAADRFVDDRLATYERMWDGCGCRIDYHA